MTAGDDPPAEPGAAALERLAEEGSTPQVEGVERKERERRGLGLVRADQQPAAQGPVVGPALDVGDDQLAVEDRGALDLPAQPPPRVRSGKIELPDSEAGTKM